MIKTFYSMLPGRIAEIRKYLQRPLSLAEKILYSHLSDGTIPSSGFKRGNDYTAFTPDRVAMQDATAQMALLQFMLAGKGSSKVPVSVHCDHLITARLGAEPDLKDALKINEEVYDFLRKASDKYNIDFWEPGSGIIHQIILENYAFPGGMIIGTDSHTPTAGGLGMIAIGAGGADAVDAMTGIPWELKWPRIIGVKLTGKLNGWASPKDVILKLTGMLTVKGATGAILEYFGEGCRSISATGKATICNMGAETGATCSLFGYDFSMKEYLHATGRDEIARMAFSVREHLNADTEAWQNPGNTYDEILEINLNDLEPYINGPFTPDLATPLSAMKKMAIKMKWPVDISTCLIGSCTNSSYQDLSRASSVIKNALDNKIEIRSELLITPGSSQIKDVAEREGFIEIFKKAGGEIFSNACGPCIGQWSRKGSEEEPVNTVIHSFNRNFSKRTDGNPNTFAFVASPEIVAALAIAGKLTFNPVTDTLHNTDGAEVKLEVPRGNDLPVRGLNNRSGYVRKSREMSGEIYINPGSERLQVLTPFSKWDGNDMMNMPLLFKAAGKCTTDHISMAGKWLKYRGHLDNISSNYMSGAVNSFTQSAGTAMNLFTKKYEKVHEVARAYKLKGIGSVVAGEENFGEGSSREHAAMEPRYLNVRAVIVKSFARIHETNLKKQGILTLTFAEKSDYDRIQEDDMIDITGLQDFQEGKQLKMVLHHSDGSSEKLAVNHSCNSTQIDWFRAGSALNLIRERD
jgi:aconitate hydratase